MPSKITCMSNSYHKNLVFTAACIGMCFFGVSMITLGAVLPSLIAKLNLSGLQTTSLVTFLPLGMLAGSLIFGPIVDRFGHKALLVPSCIIVLLGMEGLAFFESVATACSFHRRHRPGRRHPQRRNQCIGIRHLRRIRKRLTPQFSGHVLRTGRIGQYQCCWAPFPGIIHSKPSCWELA